MTDNQQPYFAEEVPFSEVETSMVREEPRWLWPQNQNSNLGEVRRIIANSLQASLDNLQTLENEMFVDTSSVFLGSWESEVGLPASPAGKSISERRTSVLGRLRSSAFTRSRISDLIEAYIISTFGSVPAFGTSGIPIPVGGIPLFDATTEVSSSYRIYENIEDYSFYIYILSSITPSADLQRELNRIIPAGLSYTLDNTQTNIHFYKKTTLNAHPVAYWRLDETSGTNANDESLNNFDGTYAGSYTLNQTSLVSTANDSGKSVLFNGSSAKVTVADADLLRLSSASALSVEAWTKISTLPTSGNKMQIVGKDKTFLLEVVNTAGTNKFVFSVYTDGSFKTVSSTTIPGTGTIYFVSGTWDGITASIYINGSLENTSSVSGLITGDNSKSLVIGSTGSANYLNGYIDEVSFYSHKLTAEMITSHYIDGTS